MQSPLHAALASHPCFVCARPTSMWCGRCHCKWYCTPEHLQSDWPRHRHECQAVSPTGMAPTTVESESSTVEAILFNPSEDRPRIITVDCKISRQPSRGITPIANVARYFPDGPPSDLVLTVGLNGEIMRFPLHLWYCPNSMERGSPQNRAVRQITAGAAQKPWCGPVVVLKYNGARRQGYFDASANDLPPLSAYFLEYK
ncbi:hypothetical protein DL96DRAFT_1583556 [Flagelloscypha sp. PMI_526]|nr:hypothetical protein DL96DRAFT_1583556 [Flagelloscypha sp. PMI_526]